MRRMNRWDIIEIDCKPKGGETMTVIYGAKGTDGRTLDWPLLELVVRECWGWIALPPVERTPRGKPLFAGLDDRWFSLSHSGGIALCALSSAPVGVDVELVRPRRANLPAYVLSESERAGFDGTWEDFCRLWTLKESWCKREDSPLFPPREVTAPPPCPHKSYAGEGWRAAVCCEDEPPREILWRSADELLLRPARNYDTL